MPWCHHHYCQSSRHISSNAANTTINHYCCWEKENKTTITWRLHGSERDEIFSIMDQQHSTSRNDPNKNSNKIAERAKINKNTEKAIAKSLMKIFAVPYLKHDLV